jgi:hypothetical protein
VYGAGNVNAADYDLPQRQIESCLAVTARIVTRTQSGHRLPQSSVFSDYEIRLTCSPGRHDDAMKVGGFADATFGAALLSSSNR